MRTTKALICAAAVAAGAISAVAQSNVYSLNVVGYINLPLHEGFNMVANQLDVDGTGTNNTIAGVFSNSLPVNAGVYVWTGTGYNFASYAKNKAGTATNWSANYPLNPGQGAWVSIPSGAFGGNTGTVTTVGTVLQGSLVNPNLAPAGGYSLVSSMVPVSGGLVSNLGYQPKLNDGVYTWNGTGYSFTSYSKNKAGTATNWSAGEPVLAVGQGFWLNSAGATTWSNNFIVQ